ncbi:MAG: hypothetical protein ACRDJ4_06270 [Actinomycetota bacterium]
MLLAAMAFAPNLAVAVGLLLLRVTLSQMDVAHPPGLRHGARHPT